MRRGEGLNAEANGPEKAVERLGDGCIVVHEGNDWIRFRHLKTRWAPLWPRPYCIPNRTNISRECREGRHDERPTWMLWPQRLSRRRRVFTIYLQLPLLNLLYSVFSTSHQHRVTIAYAVCCHPRAI
jgi:hypothetical protein